MKKSCVSLQLLIYGKLYIVYTYFRHKLQLRNRSHFLVMLFRSATCSFKRKDAIQLYKNIQHTHDNIYVCTIGCVLPSLWSYPCTHMYVMYISEHIFIIFIFHINYITPMINHMAYGLIRITEQISHSIIQYIVRGCVLVFSLYSKF